MRTSRQTGAGLLLKRAMDVVGSALLLLFGSPVLLLIGVAVRLDSRGPSLYRGDRVGRGETTFSIFKFRTMYQDTDDALHRDYVQGLLRSGAEGGDAMYKLVDDPRVTRVGRFLRKTSLDELPQLINVLRGEMSLVGPRPEVPYALEAYEPWQRERFDVLPGLTGLWQVSGRARLSPVQMLELDCRYVRGWSVWSDIKILFRTIPALVRSRTAA